MTDYSPAVIPLYKRTHLVGYALVDPEDAPRLLEAHWTLVSAGYAVCARGLFGDEVLMHRVIAAPTGKQVVDHINGNRLDNRRANLRGCTQAENMRNVRRIRNSSGVRGAHLDKRDGRWTAEIRVNDRTYGLGRYETPEEAGRVYDSAARQLHGEFAVLNYPDEHHFPDIDWRAYAESRLQTAKNQKLSLEAARQIRQLAAEGASANSLAEQFKVTPAAIYFIVQGRTYKEPPAPARLEEALSRIEAGQTLSRVAHDLAIGRTILQRAVKEKWGRTPPKTASRRRSNAKLSLDDVQDILRRVDAGERQKDLAAEYGVSAATVSGYVKGRYRATAP